MVGAIDTEFVETGPQYFGPGAYPSHDSPIILLSLIHNCVFHAFLCCFPSLRGR